MKSVMNHYTSLKIKMCRLRGDIIVLAAILFLSSCGGFQLRGSTSLNFLSAYIQSESADEFANELERLLVEECAVQLVPTAEVAQVVIYLRNQKVEKRVLSVSSASGKQEEIEILYQVELEARKPDDTILLAKQRIRLLRDYRFEKRAVLAIGAEEERLRHDMFRDIIAQIRRRLQAINIKK